MKQREVEEDRAKKMKQCEVEEDRFQILDPKVSDDVVEDPDGLALRASQILLDYYNRGVKEYKGCVFELMEVVCSSTIREHNVCTLVNLRVKKKRSANSKAVTFFGELLVRDDNVAMRVCILKPDHRVQGSSLSPCDDLTKGHPGTINRQPLSLIVATTLLKHDHPKEAETKPPPLLATRPATSVR
ncbi:hypothetical protein AKJ16_DCAP23086 [Drosera capensis]